MRMEEEEKKPGIIRRSYRMLMRILSGLRLFLANMLFLVLLVIIFMAINRSDLPSIPEQGALVLDISGSLVDQKNYTDALTQLLSEEDPEQQQTLLQDVIDAVTYAADDERINTLVLSLDKMAYGSLSKMQELLPALERFRSSGKKIIATGNSYNQQQYWLAAQADEVYLDPMGAVYLEGYGVYRNYVKNALDKLKIDFHVFRVGEYKSAMETFMREDMSEQARRANLQWLNVLWGQYTDGVASPRQLAASDINQYINGIDRIVAEVGGNAAKAALDKGLVDGLKTRDEINRYLSEQVGAKDDEGNFQRVGFQQYLWLKNLEPDTNMSTDKIGVIVAAGNIVDGKQPAGAIGGDSLSKLIRDTRIKNDIKALVLRIDSGGGSAFASELIRRELVLLQKQGIPLVVSMGSLAASGGYWIAASADQIWATPTTLTGSIGIFGAFPTFDKSLAELGIYNDGVGTTDLAGSMRVERPLQPTFARSIQSNIEYGYEQFIDLVAEGRGLPEEQVLSLAGGRVWSGIDAKELGLVDELGSLKQAITAAAELAGLENYKKQLIEYPLTPQEQLIKELTGGAAKLSAVSTSPMLSQLKSWLGPIEDSLRFLQGMNDPRGVYLFCTACTAP